MAHRGFTAKDAALTINYIGFIYRTLVAEGYCADALLKNTGLGHDDLSNPDFRCTFEQHKTFAANAMALTGDPHLGPRMGARYNPIHIGLPITAAISSDVLSTALEVLQQYLSLNFSIISLEYLHDGDNILLRWQPVLDVKEIDYFVIGSCLTVGENLLKLVLQREDLPLRADMALSPPPDPEVLEGLLGFAVRFDAPFNQLIIPDQFLQQPLPGTDPLMHQNMVRLCEKQMAESFFDQGIEAQVRGVIIRNHYHPLAIDAAAAALGLSERSLRRQLSNSATSYKKIVDGVREARARELLAVNGLPVTTIAYDLGFSDPSNFARSFKRWVGLTPHEYRDQNGSDSRPGQD
ncbi:MAG: AraC family transcriptional regulator [Candidatus Pelagadaptatus aseana]|uniref:AraC family transcriptional regulator n=1 Tax=Candidatus Pelagadaptatus aseana TaxID=3120508 RepID=UPI0039B158D7